MLTLFAIPKPFRGHHGVIQRNAIASWTRLRPACDVLLLGDDEGTRETAEAFGLRHLPGVARTEHGTPRVDALFAAAEAASPHRLMAYVNADVMLMSDFVQAVLRVANHRRPFLLIGQRWNVDVRQAWDFGPGWEERLAALARGRGTRHFIAGIDYLVFPRGLWDAIPPFAIGRTAWDNWFVYQARRSGVDVIDATDAVTAVHQNHDYSHHPQGAVGAWQGPEAARNLELAGGPQAVFTVKDATWVLTRRGVRRARGPWRLWRRVRTFAALHPDAPAPIRWAAGMLERHHGTLASALRRPQAPVVRGNPDEG